MIEEADFLKAINADPDSDGLRLIFADFLEERGGAHRAEFIRVQVELAAVEAIEHTCRQEGVICVGETGCAGCGAQAHAAWLHEHAWRLFIDHGNETRWACPEFVAAYKKTGVRFGSEVYGCFRRGLVESVELPTAVFAHFGKSLAKYLPLRTVRLTDAVPRQLLVPQPFGGALYVYVFDQHRHDGGDWPVEFYDAVYEYHESEQAALDAMSKCAIKWAKDG